jgi:hypothetical protein
VGGRAPGIVPRKRRSRLAELRRTEWRHLEVVGAYEFGPGLVEGYIVFAPIAD